MMHIRNAVTTSATVALLCVLLTQSTPAAELGSAADFDYILKKYVKGDYFQYGAL